MGDLVSIRPRWSALETLHQAAEGRLCRPWGLCVLAGDELHYLSQDERRGISQECCAR
jgi:hypothetical protein